jgi:uncharacterized protein YutE (UPF0331/DUF86 family)
MNFKFQTHNIHLFAYYLSEEHNSLGDYKQDWLWNKCDEIVAKTIKPEFQFNIKQHLNLEDKSEEPWANLNKYFSKMDDYHPIYVQSHECFIENSQNPTHKIAIPPDENNRVFVPENETATISPVKLYKTYGLCIHLNNLNIKNAGMFKDEDVKTANPDNCLALDINKDNQYFIGQTLLVTINLEKTYFLKCKHNPVKFQKIADNYLESLLPKSFRKPPFNGSGELFGSIVYQYGIIRDPNSYYHVLICFVLDNKSAKKFEEYYNQLLDLFLFRNRIIHAYNKIKKIEQEARDKSHELQIDIKKSQEYQDSDTYLDNLQKLLQELPIFSVEYADKLRNLKEFQYLIVSHTRNYADKINEIKSTFPKDENFSFLEEFIHRTCIPYQDRVNAAANFFQLDINLIDNAIDSIRGQLAIKQANTERQLQNTITSLGIGIAVAGNFLSSYEAANIKTDNIQNTQDNDNQKTQDNDNNYPGFGEILVLFWIISTLLGWCTWQAASWFLKWRYKKEQRK